MITNTEAAANLLTYINEDRLVKGSWVREQDGRHLGCLLHAAAGVTSVSECPASLMPRWMAKCTVTLFDALPDDAVKPIAVRYQNLIGRWSVLNTAQWDDVLARWLVRLVDQAVDAVPAFSKTQDYWPAIQAACEQCKSAVSAKDKDAAAYAARTARTAARAANAAGAAAARAAAYAAAYAVHAADAVDAVDAVGYVADAARAAAYAARTAARAANAAARAAYKSSFSALLDEIEIEIVKAQP